MHKRRTSAKSLLAEIWHLEKTVLLASLVFNFSITEFSTVLIYKMRANIARLWYYYSQWRA